MSILIRTMSILVVLGVLVACQNGDASTEQVEEETTEVGSVNPADTLAIVDDWMPPADGAIDPTRLDIFFDVTDQTWPDFIVLLGESERKRDEVLEGDAGPSEVVGWWKELLSAFVDIIAPHLEDRGMGIREYMWTGVEILRAYELPTHDRTVEPNIALAATRAERLADLTALTEEEYSKRFAVAFAVRWGMGTGVVEGLWVDPPEGVEAGSAPSAEEPAEGSP